ncbi:MAG: CAP domain-containing protein [Pseudomonadota bacterium]
MIPLVCIPLVFLVSAVVAQDSSGSGKLWWEKASAYDPAPPEPPAPPAAPPTPPAVPDPEPAAMAGMLVRHNHWRTGLSLPPLAWSAALEKVAQAWADGLASRGCKMVHTQDNAYGENLAWSRIAHLDPAQVVDMWGSEVSDYDYASNSCAEGKRCGHYTQVVWRGTERVGCAVAYCPATREEVWVCEYDPPGNWRGQHPY